MHVVRPGPRLDPLHHCARRGVDDGDGRRGAELLGDVQLAAGEDQISRLRRRSHRDRRQDVSCPGVERADRVGASVRDPDRSLDVISLAVGTARPCDRRDGSDCKEQGQRNEDGAEVLDHPSSLLEGKSRASTTRASSTPARSQARRTAYVSRASNRQKHDSSSGMKVELMYRTSTPSAASSIAAAASRALASSSCRAVMPGRYRSTRYSFTHSTVGPGASRNNRRYPRSYSLSALRAAASSVREWTPSLE